MYFWTPGLIITWGCDVTLNGSQRRVGEESILGEAGNCGLGEESILREAGNCGLGERLVKGRVQLNV